MDWKDGKWEDHISNENLQGYGVMMYRPSHQSDYSSESKEVIQRVIPINPDREKSEGIWSEILQSGDTLNEYKSYSLFITTTQENINHTERMKLTDGLSGVKKMVIASINLKLL